jgi:hypothetical protein
VSEKLNEFLEDDDHVLSFREFLLKQHCVENLVFWMEVKRFKKLPKGKLNHEAQLIFGRFLLPYSDMEVNLPAAVICKLQEYLNEEKTISLATRNMFDEAQKAIFLLMELDSFRAFRKLSSGGSQATSLSAATAAVAKKVA